jgi:cell division protein FtsB
VLRLDDIRDAEQLRQVAVLLERENEKLHAKIQTLTTELARLRGDTDFAGPAGAGVPERAPRPA